MREEDGRETFAAYKLKLFKKKKTWKAGKKKNSIAYVPQQRQSEEKKKKLQSRGKKGNRGRAQQLTGKRLWQAACCVAPVPLFTSRYISYQEKISNIRRDDAITATVKVHYSLLLFFFFFCCCYGDLVLF